MTGTRTQGRVAVVTGASQGIGRAIATKLAADGFVVWAVARRVDVLQELVPLSPKGSVIPAPCDITDRSAVSDLVAAIADRTPPVSALVHCAGSHVRGSVTGTTAAELTSQFTVNVEAVYRLTQQLLPRLVQSSSIVFLNSTQGLRASAGVTPFAASMHALRALADSLRDEVNERGIRVTSVFPGRTSTPRQEAIYQREGRPYQPELLLQPEDIADVVATIIGLAATAEVTDLHIRPAIRSY